MSVRELVVLGTASQVPTRRRDHNGYLLRWDGEGMLFDPREGTQRQMLLARVAAGDVTRICLTHFHGDHCLCVPGVVQRLSPGPGGPSGLGPLPRLGREFSDLGQRVERVGGPACEAAFARPMLNVLLLS